MTTDSQIQADVLNALLADSRIPANDVAVSVVAGVVTLGGEVDSLVKRIAATRAAERVSGARIIINELSVHFRIETHRTDVEIARDAVKALVADDTVPEKTIIVRVQNGCIVLDGAVESGHQRIAAQQAVEHIAGVRRTTNLLRVKSAAAHHQDTASGIGNCFQTEEACVHNTP